MKRDTILRQESEIRIGRIINNGRRNEAARGRDKRGRPTISPLGNNKTTQKRADRTSNVNRGISMNIKIVEIRVIGEESNPKRSKMEVRISEKEERNLQFGVSGGETREGRWVVGIRSGGGAIEEEEIVVFVRGGDWD